MISTGDTAFVLKQHTSCSASASGPPAPFPGPPIPGHHHLRVAACPTLALATACAHGLKG
jgi:hypothetical protein